MNTLVNNLKIEEMDFSTNEAINMLRENVLMSGNTNNVLAITSSAPNEGKSYIAFCLANSLALLGKKTVYVDCDIRNSVFKKKYNILEKTRGLSEYLCGNLTEEHLPYQTSTEHLDVIFSGQKSPNPSELLSGELFSRLIANLKASYDYVILDTPPVNVVVDATIISRIADSTIIVVRSFFTERMEAIQTKKQLEMSGAKILGVVMNLHGIRRKGYGKYGYGRYGYGKYGYGKYGYAKYGYGEDQKQKTDS